MSFLKSFAKSVRSRSFLATLSALVMVAGMLFGANIATADSVWVQSYGRTSQTEACVAQPGETPWQESWGADSSWSPSWEQWANNGKGGWTCTRSITWARDSAARVYNVGDIGPGGGTVFYVDMARAAGSQFWEVGSDLGTATWGCFPMPVPGAYGTDIGTGEANTVAITTDCVAAGIAAKVASAAVGGFTDWFLPSHNELNQLCKYARTQSTAVADQTVPCDTTGTLRIGFSGRYWSSTEDSGAYALDQNFSDGIVWPSRLKNDLLGVRAVRVF